MHFASVLIDAFFQILSTLLPIPYEPHRLLQSQIANESLSIDPVLRIWVLFGISLGLFFVLFHDVLSVASTSINALISRTRPKSLDERIPLSLGLSLTPILIAISLLNAQDIAFYPNHSIEMSVVHSWIGLSQSVRASLLGLLFFTLMGIFFLVFARNRNRRIKEYCHWGVKESIWLGLLLPLGLIGGLGRMTVGIVVAEFLNFRRTAAIKFLYLVQFVFSAALVAKDWRLLTFKAPPEGMTLLNYYILITGCAGLTFLMARGQMKERFTPQSRKPEIYRGFLGVALIILYFW